MKVSVKALMIATLFIGSMLAMPMMAFAQDDSSSKDTAKDQNGAFNSFYGGFGGIFSDNMGYAGGLIGTVFQMLLLQSLDLEGDAKKGDGLYVLSAKQEETFSGNKTFSGKEEDETYMLPKEYTGSKLNPQGDGYDYCLVHKEGGIDYNLTIGVQITLLIWDHDLSFITAAEKVLDWAQRFNEDTNGGKDDPSEEIVTEGVSVLMWLLIHINEIFTGDELFVLNPIMYQQLELRPWKIADGDGVNFEITKTWKNTGSDWEMEPTDDIVDVGDVQGWNYTAILRKDSHMQWLCANISASELMETLWTQFSFDIIQLWIKNFHIEIDVAELTKAASGEKVNPADAFSGCDIEFFLFTHHLAGAFLYNDTNVDDVVTVTYGPVVNETAPIDPETGKRGYMKNTDGTDMMLPNGSELTHQLILGDVNDFDFKEPEVDDEGNVEWGIGLKEGSIAPVPIGVDLNTYLEAKQDSLDFIEFGVKFIPTMEKPDKNGNIAATGQIKLTHNFAPWNAGSGPSLGNKIAGLDLTIIYISTILHFHLQIENKKSDSKTEDDLVKQKDYSNSSESIKIGNYLDPDSEDKLDFVDIAGEDYKQGNDESTAATFGATSNTIPLGFWSGEGKKQQKVTGDNETESDDYSTNIQVSADFNVMLYAVCYPQWNGTGQGIWHDPTFSVYMVFTPEASGFWALILLVAGLGLVGVATILIKRKKDKRI